MKLFRSFKHIVLTTLLLLFVAVQVMQCVHHHSKDKISFSLKDDHHKGSFAEISKPELKCKICDYIQDQQSKHFYDGTPEPFVVLQIPADRFNPNFITAVFERSVQTWTNKGPPLS